MRQVPQFERPYPYLIIGNGRLARHFRYYFTLLSVPHLHWSRGSGEEISPQLAKAEKVLVLISDDSIERFIEDHQEEGNTQHCWIHCSGMLSTPLAESAHPLMTFASSLYDLLTYQSIPFVTEEGRKSFPELFPELNNPHVAISSKQKNYYHAWCSMAGNFTTILWQEFLKRLENEFHIDKELAFPYMNQVMRNIKCDENSITGPLARGDWMTVKKHQESLTNDAFRSVYEAFINIYKSSRSGY